MSRPLVREAVGLASDVDGFCIAMRIGEHEKARLAKGATIEIRITMPSVVDADARLKARGRRLPRKAGRALAGR